MVSVTPEHDGRASETYLVPVDVRGQRGRKESARPISLSRFGEAGGAA